MTNTTRQVVREPMVSLEELSDVISAIHAAAESPERWPEALSVAARIVENAVIKSGCDFAELIGTDDSSPDPNAYRGYESSRDRLMALLEPHFETAKDVHAKLAEVVPGRLALASLDRLAAAAFIVDGAGRVRHRNAAAHTLLAGDRRIQVVNARLILSVPSVNKEFQAALRHAIAGTPRSSLLTLPSGGKEIAELAVSPLQADQEPPSPFQEALALVVVAQPLPDAEEIARRVRRLYSLTDAEARVMAALAVGGTVEETALAHGVRTSTVRAQVRSLFEKTGVSRQSDLVRLALTGTSILAVRE